MKVVCGDCGELIFENVVGGKNEEMGLTSAIDTHFYTFHNIDLREAFTGKEKLN